MLMEEPIFLGFCVPILIPLTCISFYLHAVVFSVLRNYCGMTLVNDTLPSYKVIGVTLGLGYAFGVWFFFACGFSGRWLVAVGPPIGALGMIQY